MKNITFRAQTTSALPLLVGSVTLSPLACSSGSETGSRPELGATPGVSPSTPAAEATAPTDVAPQAPMQPEEILVVDGPDDTPSAMPTATAEPEPPPPPMGAVAGRAWMPSNSPDQVTEALAMGVSGALVQLSLEPLPPNPPGTYCNVCVEPNGYFATTDARGDFLIEGVPEGTYTFTLQKGQFRRERTVTVFADQVEMLPTETTTLPSIHTPMTGDSTPRIAMVIGQWDSAEIVLEKLGIGEGGRDWVPGTAINQVDVYRGDGANSHDDELGTLEELVGDPDRLSQYHLVLLPCGPEVIPDWMFEEQNLRNLRNFVATGGGLFVTGWSANYVDTLFPAQLTFQGEMPRDTGDIPAEAYDPATNTWSTDLFQEVIYADSVDAPRLTDPLLRDWLVGQQATNLAGDLIEIPGPDIWLDSIIDAQISQVNEVTLGLDANGDPILDRPRILVDAATEDDERIPLGVLFRPAGCGRVMYSSYEVTGGDVEGEATPVQRVLMYSLMEISVCAGAEPPEVVEPPPPTSIPMPIPVPR